MTKTHHVIHMLLDNLQSQSPRDNRATEEGMAPDVQNYASQNPQGNTSLVGNDDESEWLLRCDAYTYISVVCQEHNGGRSRGLYMPVRCWIIITSLSDDDSRRGVAN